jgi:high-affinity iron transporter
MLNNSIFSGLPEGQRRQFAPVEELSMSAFFVSVREGLEAALVIGILLGALAKVGRRELARTVWIGVAAAILVSAAIAGGVYAAGVELEGRSEEIFEGVTLILAATFLTGMIFWMQREGRHLRARLESRVHDATGRASRTGLTLFAVAFFAVVREGAELALLLAATAFAADAAATIAGSLLGLALATFLGALIYRGVLVLNMRLFFTVTNILLLVFAAGMVGLGMHELIEAGLVPAGVDPVWNINAVLNDGAGAGEVLKTLFGYNGNPALTEVLAYVAYLAIVGWAVLRPTRTPAPARVR